MINGKTVLAIIPARSGSKRLPGKNTKILGSLPLISWTINAAFKSDVVDEVVVSTDDEHIAEIANKSGANVPFIRPKELAQDESTTVDVLIHTVEFFQERDRYFDYIMLLQPTSPLRNELHINEAAELLSLKLADAVVSVCETEHSPLWANTLDKQCGMDDFISTEIKNKRSQDLPTYYRLNGAIYLVKTDRMMSERSLFLESNIFAYKMKREDSVDIDQMIDFFVAEKLLESKVTIKE